MSGKYTQRPAMHVQISGTFLVWKYVSEQEQLLFENICLTNSEKYAIKISLLSLWTFIFIYTFMGGWWRWALVSLDGVAPSRMVSVSASVNLPLHHKVQKLSSGTGSPRVVTEKGP